MGDNYGELAELGFTGLDAFARKYHDKVADHPPWRRHKAAKNKKNEEAHPRGKGEDMYAPTRRAGRESMDDPRGDPYGRSMHQDHRSNYSGDDAVAMGGRPPNGYNYHQANPQAPSPYGYGYGYRQAGPSYYDDRHVGPVYDRGGLERGRPQPSRRYSSSYSPRRNRERHDSPQRRARSKSSNRKSIAATVVGAVAGGFVGHAVNKDSKVSTVAGAVVGGFGAREAEKFYEHRQQEEEEAERRRQRRGREREQHR